MPPLNTQQNTNPNTSLSANSNNSINDPLSISNSDHPGMVLTQTPFNRGNFLRWSRNIKMALGAKLKLGFIDGTCAKPTVTDVNYQRWIRCDYMVTCWVLNSMITELSNAFLYTQSAQELWKGITERYGQSNGPLIYQLKRELSHICQVSLNIASYFTKLKRCWDELQNLNGLPTCTCGKMRDCSCGILDKFLEIDSRSKLMQFLMKLSDEYKAVKSQILGMDPLPSVNKAYYIVQQIEKQTQTGTKEKKGKNGCQGTLDEHMIGDTPFDMGFENGIAMGQNGMFDQKLVAAVCLEVMKMFKNKGVAEGGTTNANQASSSMHYAGIFSCFTSSFALLRYPGMDVILDWISDTRASNHMSPHLHLFTCVKTLKHPINVHLPDGRLIRD
nr:hypothetical protein [Tanacetum cinerariifolium]